jgi:hypothetical protein
MSRKLDFENKIYCLNKMDGIIIRYSGERISRNIQVILSNIRTKATLVFWTLRKKGVEKL